MPFLPTFLRGLGTFGVLTGVGDALLGKQMLEIVSGEGFPVTSLVHAITDSQVRFLGSAWAGMGAMFWWVSNDLPARRTPLAILLGAVFLGGIGRSLSILNHGHATPMFVFFIGVELIGPPLIWAGLKNTATSTKAL